jgi:HK97 family phage major capsid protein
VPPLWLIDQYVALQRAGRVIANSVRGMDLPAGTDSINIPKVATGTTTAVQTADAGSVSSTDLTDTSISAPVRTLAGQQDIALQLLDQSPISFDEVVFADLHADYNSKLDQQVIFGSGSSGQATGIFNVSSVVSITYTTGGTPTLQEAYPSFAKALSQMTTARFLPPTAWFMHPRRWYWALSQLDGSGGTAGRPMIVAYQAQEFNPAALQTGVDAEGPVGNLMGLPVLLDPNIQTTVSSNQDPVYALRTPDLYLWEGTMRSRTLTEVLSGTLQVRLQIYNYFAFLGSRYPSSIGIITGTGLAAPSGF